MRAKGNANKDHCINDISGAVGNNTFICALNTRFGPFYFIIYLFYSDFILS